MRLRSVLLVDGGDGAALEAALAGPADAVAVSLVRESPDQGAHRALARIALDRIREAGKDALALVNHPRTRLLRDDLDALTAPALGGVLLARTGEPQDLRDLAVLLREFEYGRGIEPGAVAAFPVIGTAAGLVRAAEIVRAVPRVAGLVLDPTAYASDVGGRGEEHGPRLAYARGAVVAAARAADALPLIASHGADLLHLSQYGFAGSVLTDPAHAGSANAAFAPSQAEVERARRHLEVYAAARAEGAWVGRSGEELVDASSVRKARQVLAQAGES
jgi:citrate lyase subunit beta/citryl-CoA lyase